MPFGISFTILLIMISNKEVETNKKKEEDLKKRKSQVDINPPSEVKAENNIDNGNSTEQRHLNQNNKSHIIWKYFLSIIIIIISIF